DDRHQRLTGTGRGGRRPVRRHSRPRRAGPCRAPVGRSHLRRAVRGHVVHGRRVALPPGEPGDPRRARRLPRHRLPLRRDDRHPRLDHRRPADHPGQRDGAADRRRAGPRLRAEAARPRPRPLLRPAQGQAAGRGAGRLRGLGVRGPARRVAHPRGHEAGRLGRQARHGEDQPDGGLDPGRRRRLHRRAPGAGEPAVRAGLRLHRLRALHPSGRSRRGPARRPLGGQEQDRVRHPHL
ncbi:MAG: Phosphoadenylyl-sulfate reductase [thioredoxin], partial [uncultured Blastococcus sp.]